jgi:hypothetical protein
VRGALVEIRMVLDTFKLTFLIEIDEQPLSKGGGATHNVTQEIESFFFTDSEEEMDELELTVSNRNLQFVDDPLFQEGNEIMARFGYGSREIRLRHPKIQHDPFHRTAVTCYS